MRLNQNHLLHLFLVNLVLACSSYAIPPGRNSAVSHQGAFHSIDDTLKTQLGKGSPIFTLNGGQKQHKIQPLPTTAKVNINSNAVQEPEKAQGVLAAAKKIIEQNFFLSGAIFSIFLAYLKPGVAKTGGLIRPEITISKFGVAGIFFLSGLSLRLREMLAAMTHLRLNALVQAVMFGATPLYYLGLAQALRAWTPLPAALVDGVLVLGTLPCTVNMCIALTTAAEGNVASAICNAVLGNLLGVFATPALLYRHFGHTVSVPFFTFLNKIILKVLIPLLIGQTARALFLEKIYLAHKKKFSRSMDLLLISIVYATFCDVFARGGLGVSGSSLLFLMVVLPSAFTASQLAMLGIARNPLLKLSKKDQIAAMFCGTQKTLAFGMPLIQAFFEGNPSLALITTPLLVLHPMQLLIGSLLTPYLRKYAADEE